MAHLTSLYTTARTSLKLDFAGAIGVLIEAVQRLLADPKATSTPPGFFSDWIGLDGLAARTKGTTVYPNYTDDVMITVQGKSTSYRAGGVQNTGETQVARRFRRANSRDCRPIPGPATRSVDRNLSNGDDIKDTIARPKGGRMPKLSANLLIRAALLGGAVLGGCVASNPQRVPSGAAGASASGSSGSSMQGGTAATGTAGAGGEGGATSPVMSSLDGGVTDGVSSSRPDGSPEAAAATDARTDAEPSGDTSAASGCAGKSYKLCEDFETGTVGSMPATWTLLTGFGGTRGGVALANDAAHSGTMALKSDAMKTGQDRLQRSLASLGATATKHWGRIFYKVESPGPTPTSGVIHITFTALEGTTENRVVDTVVQTNGSHQWLFNIPDDSCCAGSSYNWRFDSDWHCAEWNIDVATSSFRFFSDSQEVTQLAFTGKTGARMSNYSSIALGTIFYQTPPKPVVVWFDDLAIDDNRIGCQ